MTYLTLSPAKALTRQTGKHFYHFAFQDGRGKAWNQGAITMPQLARVLRALGCPSGFIRRYVYHCYPVAQTITPSMEAEILRALAA